MKGRKIMKAAKLVIILVPVLAIYFLVSPVAALDFPMPIFTDIAPALGVNIIAGGYGSNPMDYDGDGRLDL
jgi:hypothetical protein